MSGFEDLTNLFDWNQTLPEGFILVLDTLRASGGIFLQFFLNHFQKSSHHVFLVGMDQSFGHYAAIQKKFGLNLMANQGKGQVSFINGLSSPYDWTDAVQGDGTNPTLEAINEAIPFQLNTKVTTNPLKALYTSIERMVNRQPPNKPICLIIDNINYLLESVNSSVMVLDFLQYCQNVLSSRKGCLVVLAHSDCEDDHLALESLQFRADIVMNVKGFASGISKDLDGELSFSVNPSKFKRREEAYPTLLYKATENGIKFSNPKQTRKQAIL